MQIEERLKKMKDTYDGIPVPLSLRENGWQEIEIFLTDRQPKSSALYWRAVVFAGIILLLIAGTVFAAQYAKPGDTLYAVKVASHKILNTISHKTNNKTENDRTSLKNKSFKEPEVKAAKTSAVTPTPTTGEKQEEQHQTTSQNESVHSQENKTNDQGVSQAHGQPNSSVQIENNAGASNGNSNNSHADENAEKGQSNANANNASQKGNNRDDRSDNGASHSQGNNKNK